MNKFTQQNQALLSPLVFGPIEDSLINYEETSPIRVVHKKNVQSKRIRLILEKKNKGKAQSQNQKTPPKIPPNSKCKEQQGVKLPSFSIQKINQKKASIQVAMDKAKTEFQSFVDCKDQDVRITQNNDDSLKRASSQTNRRPNSTFKRLPKDLQQLEKEQVNFEFKYYFQKLGISVQSDVAKNLQKSILQERRLHNLEEKDRVEESPSKMKKRKSKKQVSLGEQSRPMQDQIIKTQESIQAAPKIKILNKPLNNHTNHPINKTLRQINQFCYLTFVKANQNIIPKNIKFDNQMIANAAKALGIELPKNTPLNQNLFKSKNFVVQCKEILLKKIYQAINDSNGVQLQFERAQFQFYKAFVGRGNNAQLLIQLFKNNRWWWNVYQSLPFNQEGEQLLPQSVLYGDPKTINMNLYKEDFREHNLIWTQWKKLRHFHSLKPPQAKPQEFQNNTYQDENEKKRDSLTNKKKPEGNLINTTTNFNNQQEQKVVNMSNEIKIYNKLENNFHLSNKCALFYNMKRYYEAINRDPFEVIPLTFHIKQGIDDPQFQSFLSLFKQIENSNQQQKEELENEDSTVQILKEVAKSQKHAKIRNLKKEGVQKVSDLVKNKHNSSFYSTPKESTLKECRNEKLRSNKSNEELLESPQFSLDQKRKQKPQFSKNLSQGQILKNPAPQMIQSTQLPKIFNNTQQQYIQNQLQQINKEVSDDSLLQSKNVWIIKPGENTNRGNGINVTSNLQQIKSIINQGSYEMHRTFIIQKYMESPSLFKNRKFDIRCFGMLTSTNGHLKGYIYDDGYIRTSSRDYNIKKLNNKLIHLTNDAIQKKADDYGKYEAGNKISFKEYQQYLDETCPELSIDFYKDIFSQIKRIICDTFRATCQQIDPHKRHHTFEIYGYDFMLDSNFKVQLIEVNTNPCIEAGCQVLQKVIPDMLDSGLRIAIDPLFPPPNFHKRMNTCIPITLWELTFDSDLDSAELNAIFEKYDNQTGVEKQVKEYEAELIKEEDQEDEFD